MLELDCVGALGIKNIERPLIMKLYEPVFRLARLSDALPIANLSRDLIEYGLRWRWTPERVAASIRDPDANVLIARIDKKIAGFGIMRYGDDDAHLDLLAVAAAYRRAGIGRGLVRWLEECAITAGTFKIELEVRAGNEAAQLFYRSLGYAAIAHLPGYYQGVEAALRMGRDLAHRATPQDTEPEL